MRPIVGDSDKGFPLPESIGLETTHRHCYRTHIPSPRWSEDDEKGRKETYDQDCNYDTKSTIHARHTRCRLPTLFPLSNRNSTGGRVVLTHAGNLHAYNLADFICGQIVIRRSRRSYKKLNLIEFWLGVVVISQTKPRCYGITDWVFGVGRCPLVRGFAARSTRNEYPRLFSNGSTFASISKTG